MTVGTKSKAFTLKQRVPMGMDLLLTPKEAPHLFGRAFEKQESDVWILNKQNRKSEP